jgi:trimeric autotransporter adhesin
MKRVLVLLGGVLAAMVLVTAPAMAATTTPTATTTAATSVTTTTATVNATVNINGATLDALETGGGCYFEYGTSTSYGSTAACSPAPSGSTSETVSAALTGLTTGAQYQYQVVVVPALTLIVPIAILPGTPVDGGNATFTTLPTGTNPTASTLPASNITATAAQLNGSVDPNGTLSTCTFNYGTSATSLTQTASCGTPLPTGTTASAVTATLTGLTTGTTYYYDLAATNGTGTATGSVESFVAAAGPSISSPSATGVGDAAATVSASADADGDTVTCAVDYGTTTSYGQTAACAPVPSGTTPQTTSAGLTGLAPATVYHYQFVLSSNGTTWTTSDATLTTVYALTTATPSALTATSATVSGTVDPEGQTVTACEFIYGSTGGTLKDVPCTQTAASLTGTSKIPVTAAITGLTPNTKYGYELVFTTTGGGTATGGAGTFTTPGNPTAVTVKATSVTATTAILHATLNAAGASTSACAFEFGVEPFGSTTTTSTSTSAPTGLTVPCASAPTGTSSSTVSVTLKGLAPDTTYYFRILFDAGGVPVVGSTLSFKTSSASTGSKKPGVKITKSKISASGHSAKFTYAKKNYAYTRQQCSLAVVKNGKVHKHSYSSCKSPKTYKNLKAGTYEFYVRLGNAKGWGTPATKRFKI